MMWSITADLKDSDTPCWPMRSYQPNTASEKDGALKMKYRTHTTRTHARIHTLCFHLSWGHSVDIMVFILYKLYFLSPYPNLTPKPTTDTENFLQLRFSKLHSVWFRSVFPHGHQKCPYKDKDLGYWHHCGDILSPLLSKGIPEQHTHFHNNKYRKAILIK